MISKFERVVILPGLLYEYYFWPVLTPLSALSKNFLSLFQSINVKSSLKLYGLFKDELFTNLVELYKDFLLNDICQDYSFCSLEDIAQSHFQITVEISKIRKVFNAIQPFFIQISETTNSFVKICQVKNVEIKNFVSFIKPRIY